ncbi:MAG: 4-(cytidine 5'-diphospho)-2-C-methyl-D-erythritol kinase [Fimbriimonadales bacterium]|nr:4-(cytidine 5'-diphospho)-2-C-methyl-D-erythritol kinase [Fimbriimonadales bacterium]
MTVRVLCPAKLNLFLSVGPRDGRGYHPIRTVFQAVAVYDELTLTAAERDSLLCDWGGLPPDNTLTKALRLLREIATVPPLRMRLAKHIPAQAGLGGGSSDAAGLLRGVRRLLDLPLPEGELLEVARAVGADVPFFLVGGRARGEGYGERLTPLEDPPAVPTLIVRPPVGVSTAEAYRALDSLPRMLAEWPEGGVGTNDFEAVMPEECAEAVELLRSLGSAHAALTGSGSAVFGLFSTEGERDEAARNVLLQRPGWLVLATRFASRAESLAVVAEEPPASAY